MAFENQQESFLDGADYASDDTAVGLDAANEYEAEMFGDGAATADVAGSEDLFGFGGGIGGGFGNIFGGGLGGGLGGGGGIFGGFKK